MRRFESVGSLPGIAIAVLLGMLLAGASAARPPFGGHHRGPGGGHGPGRFLDFHADELGLDEEKREAIRAIVEESRGEAEGLHAQLGALHEQMRELLSADPPDQTVVMAQVEAIGAVEIQLHKHRLATLLRIRPLLTPEQRGQLKQMREDYRGGGRHRMMEGCAADAERLCPDADDGWSRRRCLRDHSEALSDACRDAIGSARKRFHHRGSEDDAR